MTILRRLSVAASLAVLAIGAHAAPHRPAVSAPMTSTPSPSDGQTPARDADAQRTEADYAQGKVDRLAERYGHLEDVTVTLGITPEGKEAVAYYTEGRIVISDAHTVSIDTILEHEIWHVIDWRDNGRLDWGEDLPPDNSQTYLRQ